MRTGLLILLVSALAGAQADDPKADEELKKFESAWRKHVDDEGGRVAAVVALSTHHSDKILKSLCDKFDKDSKVQVREEIAKAIGQYPDSDKAAKFLADRLDKCTKERLTFQKLMQGLANIKPEHTRPLVEKVNSFIDHRDMGLAVPTVNTLGVVREKSSVLPLIKRMKKLQDDMREFIAGDKKNCDGD